MMLALTTFHILYALADAGLKGVAVLALACLAAGLLRRASAAARHLVWFLAMAGLLVLPVLSLALPAWRVLPTWAGVSLVGPASAVPEAAVGPAAENGADATTPSPGTFMAASPVVDSVGRDASSAGAAGGGWRWLLALWAAGAGVALAPLVLGAFSLWRLERSARPITRGPWADLLERLQSDLRVNRRVVLLESDRRTMPMAWGLFRPRLLVPASAADWSAECRRVVLLHELAHVRRWDCLTQFIVRVARGLHWFNPLAWLGAHRATIEHETACDDLVLAGGGDAPRYAEHLLQVASRLPVERVAAAAAIAMARPSKLEGRLLAILDGTRNRRALHAASVALAVVVVAAALVPLATLRSAVGNEATPTPGPATRTVAPPAGNAKAGAAKTKPAPRPVHPAVATAEAFMKAVAAGRDAAAADLYVPDRMHAGTAKRLREVFDLSAWRAVKAWADAKRACVITSVLKPKADDGRGGAFGINLVRSGRRWLLHDMDALPRPAAVDGFVAKFRQAVPKAVQVFSLPAKALAWIPPGDLEKRLNLTPDQQAKLRRWFKEQEGKGALSPEALAGFLRTILDEKQRAVLEQAIRASATPRSETDPERQRLRKVYGLMMAIGSMFQDVDSAISRDDRQAALKRVAEILTWEPEFVAAAKGTPLEPFGKTAPNETRRLQKALKDGKMRAARNHLDAIGQQGTAAVDLCRQLLRETSRGAAPANP
jgi:beta-lactamase regulating signal transducer with metallopeptidase domain